MRIRLSSGALAAVILVVLGALLLGALGPSGDPLAPVRAQADVSCSWDGESSPADVNTGAPDLNADYLYAPLDGIGTGTHIEITGLYPHTRYFSFTLYGNSENALTSIYDQQIAPDAGSYNPYTTASKPGEGTSYTVNVLFENQPADPAPNTIYAGPNTGSNLIGFMVLRFYLPVGSPSGGVPYPQIAVLNGAGNVVLTEGACANIVDTGGAAYWQQYANENAPANQSTPANGTTPTPAWTRSFDNGYGNQQNSYLQVLVSHHWGQLVVSHFKAPTFPDTAAGQPVYRNDDIRYWSICSYDDTGTEVFGCVPDYQAPVDSDGYVTFVTSEAGQRPADATTADGVAWLPWGPANEIQLVERNLVPSPGFSGASENIATPAENPDAAQIMGAYYPTSAYCSEATFEAGGWQACLPAEAKALAAQAAAAARQAALCTATERQPITFRLRPRSPERIVAAAVFVDGHVIKRFSGRAIRSVSVPHPALTRFTVTLLTTQSNGEEILGRIIYDGCRRSATVNHELRPPARRPARRTA